MGRVKLLVKVSFLILKIFKVAITKKIITLGCEEFFYFMEKSSFVFEIFTFSYFKPFHQLQKLYRHN